jgi:hypothetical protein
MGVQTSLHLGMVMFRKGLKVEQRLLLVNQHGVNRMLVLQIGKLLVVLIMVHPLMDYLHPTIVLGLEIIMLMMLVLQLGVRLILLLVMVHLQLL